MLIAYWGKIYGDSHHLEFSEMTHFSTWLDMYVNAKFQVHPIQVQICGEE